MSDRLRVIRDQISIGDDVLVTGHGHGPPRRARVCEVMRSAVKVVYADTNNRMARAVAFKHVSRVEECEPAPAVSKPKAKAAPEPVVSVAEPVAAPAASEPNDEVQAWLEMGRDLVAKVEAELQAVQAEEAELRADASALEAEASLCAARARALTARLESLRAITKDGDL